MYKPTMRRIVLPTILCFGSFPNMVEAGFCDCLFGRSKTPVPSYPVGPPIPVAGAPVAGAPVAANPSTCGAPPRVSAYAPPANTAWYGNYYGAQMPVIGQAGAGYPAPQPTGITAASIPATVPQTMSYVPNYNSYANRAAVTYYRPLLTTDPASGAQVVVMAPCTSYEYQTQRVPTFGKSALYGSATQPVLPPAPQAMPSYTLPSGGIPIANNAPSVSLPTVRGYSPYGANPYASNSYAVQQPPVTTFGAPTQTPGGVYPSVPAGSVPSCGPGGACANGYSAAPVLPGLVAPPAASSPVYPGTTSGGVYPNSAPSPASPNTLTPSGIYPGGSGATSPDPASLPPTLPPNFPTSSNSSAPRAQLRSVVQQPMSGGYEQQSKAPATLESNPQPIRPIPAPEDFQQQRWNPGLLSEEDMTAMRATEPSRLEVAGQSKPIQWASFESSQATSGQPQRAALRAPVSNPANGLRPIAGNAHAIAEPPMNQAEAAKKWERYNDQGWSATK